MGKSFYNPKTPFDEGDRRWGQVPPPRRAHDARQKKSGTHAVRECVEASDGQSAAIYLRRAAMDERGDIARITAVLTGETVHYKTKT